MRDFSTNFVSRGPVRIPALVREVYEMGRETVQDYVEDDVPRMGAALAYYTLFSLFPLLLLLISALGYLLRAGVPLAVDAQRQVLEAARVVLPQAEDLVAQALQATAARSNEVGLVGLVTLFWSASNVFSQLDRAFQAIWDLEEQRPLWKSRLVAFLMVLVVFLFFLLSMVGMVALDVVLRLVQNLPHGALLWKLAAWGASLSITAMVFAILYRYLPRTEVHWRDVWPAAMLAALVWEGLKWGFGWYVSQANYRAIYGPVGSVIALLFWIYLSSQVLFLGGELAAVRGQRRHRRAQS